MARVLDVIEVPDMGSKEMVRRVPDYGAGDIRIGSQLIVREAQAAVFFRDGKALDTFGPGRHTLTTANIPLLVDIIGKVFSGTTPFKAEVYFVNLREFPDMGWGTSSPIIVRHPGIGVGVSLLRGFGNYGMQVSEPQLFINGFVGQQGTFQTSDIEERLRAIILSNFRDTVGEIGKSAIELQGLTKEIGDSVQALAQQDFSAVGITLKRVLLRSITPVEESAEDLAKMGYIDMQTLKEYQFAMSMRDIAQQEGGGGLAGAGMGAGAGLGMGTMMAQMMGQMAQPQAQQPTAPAGTVTCAQCGQQSPAGSKFCNNCGAEIEAAGKQFCTECGAEVSAGSKFCNNCGAKIGE